MPKKVAGRKPGVRNRNSWKVLEELRKHNFEIIDEVVELYGHSKQIYVPLITKAMDNIRQELPATTGMEESDVKAMNDAGKSMGDILGKLMSYCYPKLKALEIGTTSGEKINFSINIPTVADPKKKVIDVPKKDIKVNSPGAKA